METQTGCTVYTRSLVNLFFTVSSATLLTPVFPGVGRAASHGLDLRLYFQRTFLEACFRTHPALWHQLWLQGKMKPIAICKWELQMGILCNQGRRRAGSCGFPRSKGQHLERHGETKENHHLPALVCSKHLEFVSDNETQPKKTPRVPLPTSTPKCSGCQSIQ